MSGFVDAFRQQVRDEGTDLARGITELVDDLGRREWEDHGIKLPRVVGLVIACGSPRALADFCRRDLHGIHYRLRVSPSLVERLAKPGVTPGDAAIALTDVVRHELIHVELADELGDDPEPGYDGHGPRFANRCNRLGALLGLPPVGARPRTRRKDGHEPLPDCSRWPLVVRPPGFYGTAEAALTKGRRDRKKAPPRAATAAASAAAEPAESKPEARSLPPDVAPILRELAPLLGALDALGTVDCGSSGCLFARRPLRGMRTNGGCSCTEDLRHHRPDGLRSALMRIGREVATARPGLLAELAAIGGGGAS